MSNTVGWYIIGMLFMWGLGAAAPNWKELDEGEKAYIVFLWPITLGSIVYKQVTDNDG